MFKKDRFLAKNPYLRMSCHMLYRKEILVMGI